MNQTINCPITGLKAVEIDEDSYRIEIDNEYLFIKLGFSTKTLFAQEYYIRNRYLIAGAILNKQLFEQNENGIDWFILTSDNFEEKLTRIIYPKTPQAKLDNLLFSLYQMQSYDGEIVKTQKFNSKPEFYYKHFFQSSDECFYYLNELKYQGLVDFSTGLNDDKMWFSFTFKGLNYYLNLIEKGNLSKKCFIAMSFDKSMFETRISIKLAVEKNGFDPIIIDEQLIDSSQTINDAIIAAIKSSKFCIADFSQQKDGVYFESGFALGLGKPVIYTCHKDWFDKSHFDTNHFPHIIYKTLEDLVKQLDKKIEAWIK